MRTLEKAVNIALGAALTAGLVTVVSFTASLVSARETLDRAQTVLAETGEVHKAEQAEIVIAEPETAPVMELVPLVVTIEAEEPEVEIDPDELEMLACVIYVEAGGDACSDETRMMVGNVVLNRVADDRFPDSIEEVLLQPYQYNTFSWDGIVWPERASTEAEAHAVQRAYECAERLLRGERVLDEDVIFQSEHVQGTEIAAHQDGIYFCR